MKLFRKILSNPLAVSVFGWVLFLCALIFTFTGSEPTSRQGTYVLLLVFLGVACWLASVVISVSHLVNRHHCFQSIISMILSVPPLYPIGFVTYGVLDVMIGGW